MTSMFLNSPNAFDVYNILFFISLLKDSADLLASAEDK